MAEEILRTLKVIADIAEDNVDKKKLVSILPKNLAAP